MKKLYATLLTIPALFLYANGAFAQKHQDRVVKQDTTITTTHDLQTIALMADPSNKSPYNVDQIKVIIDGNAAIMGYTQKDGKTFVFVGDTINPEEPVRAMGVGYGSKKPYMQTRKAANKTALGKIKFAAADQTMQLFDAQVEMAELEMRVDSLAENVQDLMTKTNDSASNSKYKATLDAANKEADKATYNLGLLINKINAVQKTVDDNTATLKKTGYSTKK